MGQIRRCERCVFWDLLSDEDGLCRHSPPITRVDDPEQRGSWPVTFGGDWCGRFTLDQEWAKAEETEAVAKGDQARLAVVRHLQAHRKDWPSGY